PGRPGAEPHAVRYVLLHTPAWTPAGVRPALDSAQIEPREARVPRELVVDERPTVFVLDSESRAIFPLDVLRAFVDAGGAIVALGRDGAPDLPAEMPSELLWGFVKQPVGPRQLLVAMRAGYREAAARLETARARSEAANRSREIGELTRIGVALGTERDLKSMLVIPMKDLKEELIGVLQLINRKRHPEAMLATPADVEHQVVPYSRRTVELVTALAGQAAVAIENSRLYEEIERLFEGFVKAA